MRRWWIEAFISGRATKLSGGPTEDGGFILLIRAKKHGESEVALRVQGKREGDKSVLDVESPITKEEWRIEI